MQGKQRSKAEKANYMLSRDNTINITRSDDSFFGFKITLNNVTKILEDKVDNMRE